MNIRQQALQKIRKAEFPEAHFTDVIIAELENNLQSVPNTGVLTTFEPRHGRAWIIYPSTFGTLTIKRINGPLAGETVD